MQRMQMWAAPEAKRKIKMEKVEILNSGEEEGG